MGRSPSSSNAPADMYAPRTRAGGCRLSPTAAIVFVYAATCSNAVVRARRSSNSAYDRLPGRSCALRVDSAHHTLRRVDGQATQADRVDDREERGVDADAEAKGQHGGQRESRAAAQMADGVTQIAAQILEPDERPRVAVQVLRERDAAHRAARGQSRLVCGHAAATCSSSSSARCAVISRESSSSARVERKKREPVGGRIVSSSSYVGAAFRRPRAG